MSGILILLTGLLKERLNLLKQGFQKLPASNENENENEKEGGPCFRRRTLGEDDIIYNICMHHMMCCAVLCVHNKEIIINQLN